MGFIKLTEPGSSHVIRVKTVVLNKSGNWPDYEFSDGTDTVNVPQKAADRQLPRLNVSSALELVGATLKVSRSEKAGANGKHFWNLDLVNAAAASPTPSKRLPPPESRTTKTAHRAGPDIPGMDEAMVQDDDDFEAWSASLDAIARGEDGPSPIERELAAENASIPQTPREVANAQPDAVQRMVSQFADLYAETLGALVAVHHAAGSSTTVPHSRATDLPALTTEAVYKAALSLWIEANKRGMYR